MDRSNLHGLSLALVPQPASGTGPGVGNLAGQWNGYRGGYSGPTVGTVALQWVTVGPTVGIQPKQWFYREILPKQWFYREILPKQWLQWEYSQNSGYSGNTAVRTGPDPYHGVPLVIDPPGHHPLPRVPPHPPPRTTTPVYTTPHARLRGPAH